MALVGFPVVQVITTTGNLPSSPPNGALIYWGGGVEYTVGLHVWTGSVWELLETTGAT